MIVLLTSENNVSNKFRSLFVASEQLQSADNLSPFALISNVLIAKDAAIDNPFGTGFFLQRDRTMILISITIF